MPSSFVSLLSVDWINTHNIFPLAGHQGLVTNSRHPLPPQHSGPPSSPLPKTTAFSARRGTSRQTPHNPHYHMGPPQSRHLALLPPTLPTSPDLRSVLHAGYSRPCGASPPCHNTTQSDARHQSRPTGGFVRCRCYLVSRPTSAAPLRNSFLCDRCFRL